MTNNNQPIKLQDRQEGLVAIIVTMVVMIILTLVVVGFARLMRREQRQSLDNQLNTQAFYAAETGINDAIEALKSDPTLDTGGTCGTAGVSNVLDASTKYSCLIVNSAPTSLEYSDIGTDYPRVIPIKPIGGGMNQINFSWQAKDGSADFDCPDGPGGLGSPDLPPTSAWTCATGMIRLDLVEITPGSGAGWRNKLNDGLRTLFLYPTVSGATPTPYSVTAETGKIVPVACNSGMALRYCQVNITSLSPASDYYIRIMSLYRSSAVTIQGFKPGGGGAGVVVRLSGAQALIDSTGRATDVLRRMQVRVSLDSLNNSSGSGNGPVPSVNGLQTASKICKLYVYIPAPAAQVIQNDSDPDCNL